MLRTFYRLLRTLLVDPAELFRRWRGLPYYLRNADLYRRTEKGEFPIRLRDLYYTAYERFSPAGTARGHYFHQDLWAPRHLYRRQVRNHVDVGSRVDGFVAHVLPFCDVEYVDIRPLDADIPGLTFRHGSILELPFEDGSVPSLSSLHVIEHIGLGRYGDPVDARDYACGFFVFRKPALTL